MYTFFCNCCKNPHIAIQFSEDQIEALDYFLDTMRIILQTAIDDTKNETEEYRLECAEELTELVRLIQWIKPVSSVPSIGD